jgi:tripartite-type tricarboxylate transporter receptor subunit TctC
MEHWFMRTLIGLLAFVLSAAMARAEVQSYPIRPVTIIVPFAAGGPTDVIARSIGEHLKMSLGQTVIVENVGGGGGTIGTGRVVRAAPDGYTIGIGHWGTHVVAGAVYPIPYNLLHDLEPIALLSHNPQMIVSNLNVPAKDLEQLLAWIKDNPEKVAQGTTGAGSAPHVAGVLLHRMLGIEYRFVPYRGGAPAVQDLIAGHINLMIANSGVAFPHVRAGKIRAYAVTSQIRMVSAPEIPTVDEAGLPGFHTSIWHAFWAPAKTPETIIAQLNNAIRAALRNEVVRKQLEGHLGQDIVPPDRQTPAFLRQLHKEEIEKWWPIVRGANIKGQ